MEQKIEQTRKNLKLTSIIILVFAAFTALQAATSIFTDFSVDMLPEGASENLILISQIFLAVITVLVLIPQVYVGVRGLQLAKNPVFCKAHIVWAIILLAVSVLALISPVINIVENGGVKDNMLTIFSILAEALAYVDFIIYAKALNKAEN